MDDIDNIMSTYDGLEAITEQYQPSTELADKPTFSLRKQAQHGYEAGYSSLGFPFFIIGLTGLEDGWGLPFFVLGLYYMMNDDDD